MATAVVQNGMKVFPHTTLAIATTHSVFNVVNTLLFLPFLPVFVRLLERMVPAKAFKEKPRLTDLDIRILETPLLAIEQSRGELKKMAEGCDKMMGWLMTLLQEDERDEKLTDRLKHRERVLDSVQDEVAEFITHLLAGNVPHSAAEEARRQLRMADEYESVSDYIANLDRFDRKLRAQGHRFTSEQREDVAGLHSLVTEYLQRVNQALVQQNRNILPQLVATGRRVRDRIKGLRRKHLDDLSNGTIPPQVSVAFMATLNAYARVRDHSHNIAEAISGEK